MQDKGAKAKARAERLQQELEEAKKQDVQYEELFHQAMLERDEATSRHKEATEAGDPPSEKEDQDMDQAKEEQPKKRGKHARGEDEEASSWIDQLLSDKTPEEQE